MGRPAPDQTPCVIFQAIARLFLAGLEGEVALSTADSVHSQCPAVSGGSRRHRLGPPGPAMLRYISAFQPGCLSGGPHLRHFLGTSAEASLRGLAEALCSTWAQCLSTPGPPSAHGSVKGQKEAFSSVLLSCEMDPSVCTDPPAPYLVCSLGKWDTEELAPVFAPWLAS